MEVFLVSLIITGGLIYLVVRAVRKARGPKL